MKIAEVARITGLGIHTIRFYEKSGICPPIVRSPDGNRRFSPENVEWLSLLSALRDTDMPTQRMKRFADFYQRGDATLGARKAMLLAHASDLDAQQARLDRCRGLLAHKIARYDAILEAPA